MKVGIIFGFERDVGLGFVVNWIVEMLVLLEVWKEIFPAPTFVSEFGPLILQCEFKFFETRS